MMASLQKRMRIGVLVCAFVFAAAVADAEVARYDIDPEYTTVRFSAVHKPVDIMGASIGMTGTVSAQYHLRQMLVFLNMFPLSQSEVMIANAAKQFNAGRAERSQDVGEVQAVARSVDGLDEKVEEDQI